MTRSVALAQVGTVFGASGGVPQHPSSSPLYESMTGTVLSLARLKEGTRGKGRNARPLKLAGAQMVRRLVHFFHSERGQGLTVSWAGFAQDGLPWHLARRKSQQASRARTVLEERLRSRHPSSCHNRWPCTSSTSGISRPKAKTS